MTSASDGIVWRLHERAALHWRQWDDEWTVFDVGSGQTHLMDTLTALAVMALEVGPASAEALAEQWSEDRCVGPKNELAAALKEVLGRLSAIELIEPIAR